MILIFIHITNLKTRIEKKYHYFTAFLEKGTATLAKFLRYIRYPIVRRIPSTYHAALTERFKAKKTGTFEMRLRFCWNGLGGQ